MKGPAPELGPGPGSRLSYLLVEDDAAPPLPVELEDVAPEPDGAGAGAVEDDEDDPPGTTTVCFSLTTSLVLLEVLPPLEPGATTVSLLSLQPPSANAPRMTKA